PATSRGRRSGWDALMTIEGAVSAMVAAAAAIIWEATGAGYFWPRWVWFALAIPLALQGSLRRALRVAPGRRRPLAIHAAVFAVLGPLEVVVWLLSGLGYFWPVWPVVGLALALGAHACVVFVTEDPARQQELVERVDVLTRTRRGALDVQAAELRRIERDLHDGAQVRLVALTMYLGRAEDRLSDQPELADLVRRARLEASAAIAELRDLARGIAPPVLADRGLEAAVDALGQRSAIPVTVDVRVPSRPLPVIETAAYFVVSETLANVAKHAGGAGARVAVRLDGDLLVVEVSDDGPGGADPSGGGLTGLRRRVEALDGTLSVVSDPGTGTTIRAELPCVS
ncbi:MAG TPA: ATP-binding protein, partial [Solirubrobacteraceae bacterium]|nr:ATP-binding protein [Solirubrobacteraceae bacterium]